MSKPFPGHYIREWRQDAQLSQADFAREIGMSPSNLNQIESGRIGYTQATLEKMAARLKIRPAALLSVNPVEVDREASQADETPKLMPQIEDLLAAMQPATRSLALDLLKTALRHEKLIEDLGKPGPLNLRKTMLNEKFRM
jgi:transcriptional regulator with XRE-family HTH domain